jgi:hypothetical protein
MKFHETNLAYRFYTHDGWTLETVLPYCVDHQLTFFWKDAMPYWVCIEVNTFALARDKHTMVPFPSF